MFKHSRTFWLARRGADSAEYEDAFAANDAAGRFAVADGATEGCFTGLWARLLVERFVGDGGRRAGSWPDALAGLQEQWHADLRARKLPWYAEQSVGQGAFATFLGLVLTGSAGPLAGEGTGVRENSCGWEAVAVGDACLLHTRDRALLRAFPLERADQFDNFPKLVGSRMSVDNIRARQSLWTGGRGAPGDRLWMMTDALAQWCLSDIEAGQNPWNELESLLAMPEKEVQFVSLIEGLRSTGKLRNDDVTLLAIEL